MVLEKINTPEQIKRLSYQELETLAQEIRNLIINTTSANGGHVAPSLGVVELTLALHYAFDSPKDKIIWDVGHQCYAHKIITGRRDSFCTLRQKKGVSGFPKRSESIHDIIETGHSSTSISSAAGIAAARDIQKKKYHVIPVIGDGALNGGLALEGLNNIGHLELSRLIVILNDNKMSISPNVGALSNYLNQLRMEPVYNRFKGRVESSLKNMPMGIGNPVLKALSRFKDGVRNMFVSGALFESLGIKYIGPVNGHDMRLLIEVLHASRDDAAPLLIHVITKKGCGYVPAENDPSRFHGLAPYEISSGRSVNKSARTWTGAFSEKLVSMARKDERITAVTAAMAEGTGLDLFRKEFPNRFFDVGICEEHAVTFACGMALEGLRPVAAIYSTFLQRSLDQLIHDAALQKAPVIFALDRAGLVGEDGPTHHGVFDLSYLRMIPNVTVLAPVDEQDLDLAMNFALKADHPVFIRYPRGSIKGSCSLADRANKIDDNESKKTSILKWSILKEGKKTALISTGPIALTAHKAAQTFKSGPAVIKAAAVKPMDTKMLDHLFKEYQVIITCEENALAGGFGSGICEYAAEKEYKGTIKRIGIKDDFIEHGTIKELHELCGLDLKGICKVIRECGHEPKKA
jgi:1-deoxy-D-xylulose-5-phosphate synthase